MKSDIMKAIIHAEKIRGVSVPRDPAVYIAIGYAIAAERVRMGRIEENRKRRSKNGIRV